MTPIVGVEVRAVATFIVVALSVWTGTAESRHSSALGRRQSWDVPRRRLLVEADPQARCDLCQENWLFVLGAGGRTGSTTAMTMFDSVPGFELSGEHWGLLEHGHHLLGGYERTTEGANWGQAWKQRPSDRHAVLCSLQELTKRVIFGADYKEWITNKTKVIGFKEVRYTRLELIHFLAEVFPCARYVITYREDTDVAVKADGFSQGATTKNWDNASHLFQRLAGTFNNTYSMLPVEGLTTAMYNSILHDVLGVSGCSFNHILHDNAGGGYAKDQTADNLIDAECDLSGVDFRLGMHELQKRKHMWHALRHEKQTDKMKDAAGK